MARRCSTKNPCRYPRANWWKQSMGVDWFNQTSGGDTPDPFVPSDITDLIAWYDGDDEASMNKDGAGVVTQWNDKSGKDYHVSQGTASRRPVWSATGLDGSKPAILMDGVDDLLLTTANVPDLHSQAGLTVFIVGKVFDRDLDSRILIDYINASATSRILIRSFTPDSTEIQVANGGSSGGTTKRLAYNKSLMRFHYDGSLVGNLKLNQAKNTFAQTLAYGGTLPTTTAAFDAGTRLQIGGTTTVSNVFYKGYYSEILIYNRALTVDEIADIEEYLYTKWSLSNDPDLYTFGDSFTIGQAATSNYGFSQQFLAVMGYQQQLNQAISGKGVFQAARIINGLNLKNAAYRVIWQCGLNDMNRGAGAVSDPVNTQTVNKIQSALTSFLINQFLTTIVPGNDASVAKTGNYSTNFDCTPTNIGGRSSTGLVNNAGTAGTASYNFTGDNVAIQFIGNAGVTDTYGSVDIYIDEVLNQTVNLNDRYDNVSDLTVDNRRGPVGVWISGLSSGAHTVRVEASGGLCPIDFFSVLSYVSGQQIYIGSIPYCTVTGYSSYNAFCSTESADAGNVVIDSVCDLFIAAGYPVKYVNTNLTYVANGTNTNADGIHPNSTGHTLIKNDYITTVTDF